MGIVRIIDKDADEGAPRPSGGAPVRAVPARSAEALQAAWDAARLPGKPPAVDFAGRMAIFLAGPEGCGIVGIRDRKKAVVVLYADDGFKDASARVKAVALSDKPILLRLSD